MKYASVKVTRLEKVDDRQVEDVVEEIGDVSLERVPVVVGFEKEHVFDDADLCVLSVWQFCIHIAS